MDPGTVLVVDDTERVKSLFRRLELYVGLIERLSGIEVVLLASRQAVQED